MLLLAVVGVVHEEIAADYLLSAERLTARYAARGEQDQGPLIEAYLSDRGTNARAAMMETLAGLEPETALRDGGLTSEDIACLRRRLLLAGTAV
jgi:hypothetical protein